MVCLIYFADTVRVETQYLQLKKNYRNDRDLALFFTVCFLQISHSHSLFLFLTRGENYQN